MIHCGRGVSAFVYRAAHYYLTYYHYQMSLKSTRWCFTLNNYTDKDLWFLRNMTDPVYLIFGKEVGESGTPHLQGYVVFAKQKTLRAVNMWYRMHWEIAMGTTAQASEYCRKEDPDPYEYGCQPVNVEQQIKGQKDHWADVIRSAKEGTVEAEYPSEYVRYYSCLSKLSKRKLEDLDSYSGLWYYGPPGSGKSRSARAKFPGLYNKMLNKWWDNYDSEEAVLLDDLSLSDLWVGDRLKQWTDHYPFRAETKGSTVMIRPQVIIVTSNYKIEDLWTDPALVAALNRRFKVVNFPSEVFPAVI